ncbi:sugar nucleotide-binding protein [Streptomyces narbonensis]|uniref:sugar nucleotide-binding protein n=1 Tax=Streptomyces narbonensis TaxID=67333 RepID=UPI003F4D088E
MGHGRSPHEKIVHELAAGTRDGVLFTDDIRCPIHVADLAAALLELATADAAGVHHLAGCDAVSRYELGTLIAERAGLDTSQLPTSLRADSALPGPLDVRLKVRSGHAGPHALPRTFTDLLTAAHGVVRAGERETEGGHARVRDFQQLQVPADLGGRSLQLTAPHRS